CCAYRRAARHSLAHRPPDRNQISMSTAPDLDPHGLGWRAAADASKAERQAMSQNPEWSRRYAERCRLAGPPPAQLARIARWETEAAERRRSERSFHGRLLRMRRR